MREMCVRAGEVRSLTGDIDMLVGDAVLLVWAEEWAREGKKGRLAKG